jgi:MoaA/NifB/PqqE/SkfB family radical SAM enzyme
MNKLKFLGIRVTRECFFNCAFCDQEHSSKEKMTLEEYRKALSELDLSGALVCINGGEPTLSPSIVPLLALIKEKKPAKIRMYSTGLYDPALNEKLTEYVDEFSFSLHEYDAGMDFSEEYKEFLMDKLKANIREIKRLSPRKEVRLKFVVTNKNKGEMLGFFEKHDDIISLVTSVETCQVKGIPGLAIGDPAPNIFPDSMYIDGVEKRVYENGFQANKRLKQLEAVGMAARQPGVS